MKKYVLSIDQGTTSSRCMIFRLDGQCVGVGQKAFEQYYPEPGWVSHDPAEIYSSVLDAISLALRNASIPAGQIAAIGITNQRETTIVWERESGRAIAPAIVWQCRRTASICEEWKNNGWESLIHRKTGLIVDAYFSATKIRYILDREGREYSDPGRELMFGTVDTWLIYKLTGHKAHLTDESNASRTMLFNTEGRFWDDELCRMFGIPIGMLPEVRSSFSDFGIVDIERPCELNGIPITGVAGDQAAALFGQLCLSEGDVKNTYGTGCFTLMNTGSRRVLSDNGLLSSIAWTYNGKTSYALEGSVFHAGSIISWLQESMGIITSPKECDSLAESVEDSGGVVLVPAFSGLGAPYWDMYARALIIGLTRGSNRAHIAKAALECIAFQVFDLIDLMQKDSGFEIRVLRVDGGVSVSKPLLKFQADLLRVPVDRPIQRETTSLGVAFMAGLQVGFWTNLSEIASLRDSDLLVVPSLPEESLLADIRRWHDAVSRSMHWIDEDEIKGITQ